MVIHRLFIFTIVVHVLFGQLAHAELSQLITRVPERSNAVVVIDVPAVLSSPMARRGNWEQGLHHARTSGMISLPSELNWFLMAAEIDYEFMQPIWEIAVAHMPQRPSMKEIAQHSGGRIDRLAGADAVERPNDSYVVAYGPKIVGAMSPANRQQVIRWVRESRVKRTPDVSDYLAETIEVANQGQAQMVIGFDLGGLLAAEEIESELSESKSLEESEIDRSELARILARIQGARLEITFQNVPQTALRVSFAEGAAALQPIAGTLLAEILGKHGAHVQDVGTWKVTSSGKDLLFQGVLSESGLRRVLSVLSGPVGPWVKSTDYPGKEQSSENAMAELSRRYFQTVTGYLDDLFVDNVAQPQSLYQVEVWLERYARQIEKLDTKGVDPDVVTFADDVLIRLREIGDSLQRAQQRSDIRESTMNNYGRSRYGRYGAYGYFEKGYVTRDRQLIQADEGVRGLREGSVIVEELRTLSADTRRAMTERYGIQF